VKVMNVRAVDESASNLFYCLNKLRFKVYYFIVILEIHPNFTNNLMMISGKMSRSWLGHLDEIVECTLEHVRSGRPRANQHCICTKLNRFRRY
jgi:hypothetical protein